MSVLSDLFKNTRRDIEREAFGRDLSAVVVTAIIDGQPYVYSLDAEDGRDGRAAEALRTARRALRSA